MLDRGLNPLVSCSIDSPKHTDNAHMRNKHETNKTSKLFTGLWIIDLSIREKNTQSAAKAADNEMLKPIEVCCNDKLRMYNKIKQREMLFHSNASKNNFVPENIT